MSAADFSFIVSDMREINGSTRLLAIIGDPIAQVRSPGIFNPLIRAAGINAVLIPFHVPAQRFEDVIEGIMGLANLDGLVITYPFKERALGLVQAATERARLVGGVNAMRREADGSWLGDMFDGVGLMRGLTSRTAIAGTRILLIGAGGAGRAIGVAFAEAGASAITVADLERGRAEALVGKIRSRYPDCRAALAPTLASSHDIIVNATPVGMTPGDGLPADVGPFSPAMTVVDIVSGTQPTVFLRAAAAQGATTIPGAVMTEGQAAAILEFFGIGRRRSGPGA